MSEEELESYRNMESNLLKLYTSEEGKGNNLKLDRTGLFPQRGIISEMSERGISKEAAAKYEVEKIFTPEGAPVGYSFLAFQAGEEKPVAQKVKRLDKKMKWLYEGSTMPQGLMLFGQQLFASGGKFITITEGEEDAIAAWQMLKENSPNFDHPVVSVFNGSANAEKECKIHWEYINSFENIIICFDGDEPGRKAAERVAKLFDYRPRIMFFSDYVVSETRDPDTGDLVKRHEWKDANDYLKGDKAKEFIRLWWGAEKFAPKGVLPFSRLWDSMTKEDAEIVVPFPWAGLEAKLQGMRTGRFLVMKAPPKIGKTLMFKELIYQIHSTSPYNVGIIFLEDTKKSIGLGMCALHMNRPIQFPNVPYTLEELQEAHVHMSKDERLTLFDPEDERSVENIFNKIMYFVKAHDCKFIFLDHMSMLAYQAEDDNERKFLDKLTADLKAMTNKLDIFLAAIIHVNDDGKTRGSRAPVQLCDMLINLSRDKLNEDPVLANTTEVIVEENRLTGDSGTACHLWFNKETGRLVEIDPQLGVEHKQERKLRFDD